MKNTKSRITTRERLEAFAKFEDEVCVKRGYGNAIRIPEVDAYIINMLNLHVRAFHKRHSRKNIFCVKR